MSEGGKIVIELDSNEINLIWTLLDQYPMRSIHIAGIVAGLAAKLKPNLPPEPEPASGTESKELATAGV